MAKKLKTVAQTYTIGIVNSSICTTGILDQLLHEGHTIKLFAAVPNIMIDDGMGLGNRYPKTFTTVNEGHFYSSINLSNPLITRSLMELADTCDFIMFDYDREAVGVAMADFLRGNSNTPVIGPSDYSLKLEMDRPYGKAQAEKSGLKNLTRTYQAFSASDALKAVSKKSFGKRPFLIKGDAITIKPMNYEDGIDVLSQHYANQLLGTPMFIEEVVPGNFEEIAFSFFFDGVDYMTFVLVNREYKGIYNAGRGNIMCGEAGTACEFIDTINVPNKILTAASGIIEQLKASGYRGQVDLNTLWSPSQSDFHFLEWTCRSGIPTEHIIATAMGAACIGYGNHLASLCNLRRHDPIVDGAKMVAVALQYQNTQADYNGVHAPKLHDLCLNDTASTPISVAGHPAYVALLHGSYHKSGSKVVVRANKIHLERTAIVIAIEDSYAECVDTLSQAMNLVCPWSHHYRTDVGCDLQKYGSLLEVLL